jgi:hypothetical protein
MRIISNLIGLISLTILGTGSALAETIVVDINGGAGFDFLDIQSAIDAASAGDLILVHPGNYSDFTMSIGVTVLGSEADHSTVLFGIATVTGVPANQRAVLSGLKLRAVNATNNMGHVTLDSLELWSQFEAQSAVVVINCADVRIYECDVEGQYDYPRGQHGVSVVDSRLEVIGSVLRGGDGLDLECSEETPGGDGLNVRGHSTISVFESSLYGGKGGDPSTDCTFLNTAIGDGGNGLFVKGSSSVVLAGTGEMKGGAFGLHPTLGLSSNNGFGVVVGPGSFVRHSTVTISSVLLDGGAMAQAMPDDPFVQRFGTLQAGRLQTFWIHGTPGDAATLHLGRSPLITEDPLQAMDDLISHERSWSLGPIPPSGSIQRSFTIPLGFEQGFEFFAQAETDSPTNERRSTNSIPLVIRHL